MIDVNDIMLGNYVKLSNVDYWVDKSKNKINKIDIDDFLLMYKNPALFDPIKITEDLLLNNLGFKKEKYLNDFVYCNTKYIYLYLQKSLEEDNYILRMREDTFLLRVNYIHQLQNAYKMLTKCLIIK